MVYGEQLLKLSCAAAAVPFGAAQGRVRCVAGSCMQNMEQGLQP